ncbi:MAG: LysR family transcriptional regulator [Lachnospiraceae bacterium]|nr:LysR family transcriptional regulator [Lachnospiraceae bacterium]
MNIDALRNFIVIAEEENITTASRKLHIAQPPLSRQLKALEEDLGVSLFYRNKQRIHLTEEGKYLLDSAKSITETIDKTRRQIKEISNGKSGTIYIGAAEAAYVSLLPESIRLFHEKNPRMMYHLSAATSSDICNSLIANKLDVGIVLEPYNNELFDGIRIYSGSYLAAFSDKNVLNKEKEKPLKIKELAQYPLIVSSRKAAKQALLAAMAENSLEPNIVCEYSLLMAALSMAQVDLGVAVIPSSAISLMSEYPGLSYRHIVSPQVDLHLALIRKKNENLDNYNPAVDNFWDFMNDRFSPQTSEQF